MLHLIPKSPLQVEKLHLNYLQIGKDKKEGIVTVKKEKTEAQVDFSVKTTDPDPLEIEMESDED